MRFFDYYFFASTTLIAYFWFASIMVKQSLEKHIVVGLLLLFLVCIFTIIVLKPFPNPDKELEIIRKLEGNLTIERGDDDG